MPRLQWLEIFSLYLHESYFLIASTYSTEFHVFPEEGKIIISWVLIVPGAILDTLQIFGGTAYLLTGIARQLAPHCTYPSGLIIFKERISTHFGKKKTKQNIQKAYCLDTTPLLHILNFKFSL